MIYLYTMLSIKFTVLLILRRMEPGLLCPEAQHDVTDHGANLVPEVLRRSRCNPHWIQCIGDKYIQIQSPSIHKPGRCNNSTLSWNPCTTMPPLVTFKPKNLSLTVTEQSTVASSHFHCWAELE